MPRRFRCGWSAVSASASMAATLPSTQRLSTKCSPRDPGSHGRSVDWATTVTSSWGKNCWA